MKSVRDLALGATLDFTEEEQLGLADSEQVLLTVSSTRANALKHNWQPFVNTREVLVFLSRDKIEQELEIMGEEYKATRDNIAQIMLIKSLIRPISRAEPREGVVMKSLTTIKASEAEIGMKLQGIATSVVPTAFDFDS